jgi:hypothetical protein
MQDVYRALWDGHQPLTSACTTVVLNSVQRDALHLYVAAGKWGRQSLVAASNCNNSNCLCVMDQYINMSFLVDTGTDLCIYPHSCLGERLTQTSYELFAESGASVGTYGGHIKVLAGSFRYHTLLQDFPDIIMSGLPM